MSKTKIELKVVDMTGEGVVRTIENTLSTQNGVDYAHVNLGAGKIIVEFDDSETDPSRLIGALDKLGFQAVQEP